MVLRARRVDDRIRELCAQAVDAESSHQATIILAQLQEEIHQYTQRLRNRAVVMLSGCSNLAPDRRRTAYDRPEHCDEIKSA